MAVRLPTAQIARDSQADFFGSKYISLLLLGFHAHNVSFGEPHSPELRNTASHANPQRRRVTEMPQHADAYTRSNLQPHGQPMSKRGCQAYTGSPHTIRITPSQLRLDILPLQPL